MLAKPSALFTTPAFLVLACGLMTTHDTTTVTTQFHVSVHIGKEDEARMEAAADLTAAWAQPLSEEEPTGCLLPQS